MTRAARDYQWGEARQGLQIGLWAARTTLKVGEALDLAAAARNSGKRPIAADADWSLVVQLGDRPEPLPGGPRPSSPHRLAPGELLEVLSWRLGEQLGSRPGTVKIWVEGARDPRLRSGVLEVRLEGPGAAR